VRGVFKNRDGSNIKQSPKALLPKDKVRFPGEAVAMVVAESAAIAKDAAELAAVDYDALPASASLESAANGADIWDDAPGNLVFDWAEGNEPACNAAFAGAAKTVAVELVQNRVVPSPMEPRAIQRLAQALTSTRSTPRRRVRARSAIESRLRS
jgi:carbon-monoxide dehydrogenase large subunit